MPIEPKSEKRQRGGQKGNQNARTHGFYSASLSPEEINSIWTLISREHVAPDTAILRVKIMSLLHRAPADRRVLKAVIGIIIRWSSDKYNFDRKQRAVIKAAIAELYEQRFGIPMVTKAQKVLLRKYDILINVPAKDRLLVDTRITSPSALENILTNQDIAVEVLR